MASLGESWCYGGSSGCQQGGGQELGCVILLLSSRLGRIQDGLHWAFAFPGSTSRCHWLWSLHCLQKGKVLQRGREEMSWQENTGLAFSRERVFVGGMGREDDATFDIPPREIILPSTLG